MKTTLKGLLMRRVMTGFPGSIQDSHELRLSNF